MPHHPKDDLPYAYDLITRMSERAMVNGQPLGSLLLDETYNLWQCFSQSAFFDDALPFSHTKRFADVAERYHRAAYAGMSLGHFLHGLIALLVTLITLVGMRFGKPRVLVFSMDRVSEQGPYDFRMEKIYRELATLKVPYVEVFHTILGRRFLRNFLKRRRAAIYLEGIEWLYYVGRSLARLVGKRAPALTVTGLESFTPDEQAFLTAVIRKYVSVAGVIRFRADFLTRALKGRIRAIFAIDDARHYHEVMIAGRRLGIASYAFQHGHVTPYHLAWLRASSYTGEYARPDYLIVWNDYWKDELRALDSVWPDEAVIVAGNPKERSVLTVARAVSGDPRVVVIPYETHAPREVVRTAIENLVACGASVILKLRPDVSKDEQLAAFGALPPEVTSVTHLSELRSPVTAVLGTSSTFLYDAAEAGLPVGLIRTPLKYTKRMAQNGLAEEMTAEGVCAGVERLALLSASDTAFRQKVLAPAGDLAPMIRDILARANGVR